MLTGRQVLVHQPHVGQIQRVRAIEDQVDVVLVAQDHVAEQLQRELHERGEILHEGPDLGQLVELFDELAGLIAGVDAAVDQVYQRLSHALRYVHLALDQQAGEWTGALDDPLLGETTITNLKVSETRIGFTFKR